MPRRFSVFLLSFFDIFAWLIFQAILVSFERHVKMLCFCFSLTQAHWFGLANTARSFKCPLVCHTTEGQAASFFKKRRVYFTTIVLYCFVTSLWFHGAKQKTFKNQNVKQFRNGQFLSNGTEKDLAIIWSTFVLFYQAKLDKLTLKTEAIHKRDTTPNAGRHSNTRQTKSNTQTDTSYDDLLSQKANCANILVTRYIARCARVLPEITAIKINSTSPEAKVLGLEHLCQPAAQLKISLP